MNAPTLSEMLALPAEQRLRLLELIWASLSSDASKVPLGDAHRAALDAELDAYRANPAEVLSIEQFLEELRLSK